MRRMTFVAASAALALVMGCGGEAGTPDTQADGVEDASSPDGDTSGDSATPDAADTTADLGPDVADAEPEDVPVTPVTHPGWCTAESRDQGELTRTVTQKWDAQDRLVEQVFDAASAGTDDWKRTWTYDGAGRIVAVVDSLVDTGEVTVDRSYTYDAASGLMTSASETLGTYTQQWEIEVSGGRVRNMKTSTNGQPGQVYDRFEWDEADDRLLSHDVVLSSNDSVAEFSHYTYKPNNPGMGKLAAIDEDLDFEDGLVDYRTSYAYHATYGMLVQQKRSALDVQTGSPFSTTTTDWDYVFPIELETLESMSVDGELRETYGKDSDGHLVVTDPISGCETVWDGEIVEVQRKGGVLEFHGNELLPLAVGAKAYYEVQGRRLRAACGADVSYEATYDEAGNLLEASSSNGSSVTTYGYDCW